MKKKWIALPLLVACLFTGCEQTQEVQQGKNTQQSEPIKEEKNTEEIETQIVEEFTQVIEESTEETECDGSMNEISDEVDNGTSFEHAED